MLKEVERARATKVKSVADLPVPKSKAEPTKEKFDPCSIKASNNAVTVRRGDKTLTYYPKVDSTKINLYIRDPYSPIKMAQLESVFASNVTGRVVESDLCKIKYYDLRLKGYQLRLIYDYGISYSHKDYEEVTIIGILINISRNAKFMNLPVHYESIYLKGDHHKMFELLTQLLMIQGEDETINTDLNEDTAGKPFGESDDEGKQLELWGEGEGGEASKEEKGEGKELVLPKLASDETLKDMYVDAVESPSSFNAWAKGRILAKAALVRNATYYQLELAIDKSTPGGVTTCYYSQNIITKIKLEIRRKITNTQYIITKTINVPRDYQSQTAVRSYLLRLYNGQLAPTPTKSTANPAESITFFEIGRCD